MNIKQEELLLHFLKNIKDFIVPADYDRFVGLSDNFYKEIKYLGEENEENSS